jgi:hypothetical protein
MAKTPRGRRNLLTGSNNLQPMMETWQSYVDEIEDTLLGRQSLVPIEGLGAETLLQQLS